MSTPHLLEKFHATFEPYWESREFEPYRPASDGKRPRAALVIASGAWQRGPTITLSELEVHPKPFQAAILEELDAVRVLHDRVHARQTPTPRVGRSKVLPVGRPRIPA